MPHYSLRQRCHQSKNIKTIILPRKGDLIALTRSQEAKLFSSATNPGLFTSSLNMRGLKHPSDFDSLLHKVYMVCCVNKQNKTLTLEKVQDTDYLLKHFEIEMIKGIHYRDRVIVKFSGPRNPRDFVRYVNRSALSEEHRPKHLQAAVESLMNLQIEVAFAERQEQNASKLNAALQQEFQESIRQREIYEEAARQRREPGQN